MPPQPSIDMDDDDDELTAEIQAQVDEWSSNSNDCFTVQLTRKDGTVAASFQPEFTYAMFGNEEAIFGYQDLSITLSFQADHLDPKLHIKYGKKFQAQGEVKPTDIKEALRDFLPDSAFDKKTAATTTDFKPPGEKIHTYARNGKSYETYCASLEDPAARAILENMQILVPMFIDGGSTLELEQDWTAARWKIFLVYEVADSTYTFAGFGTSYRTFTFPERKKTVKFDPFSPTSQGLDAFLVVDGSTNVLSQPPDFDSPLDLPCRERLSQFLMLPPWHGAGHGQELYNTMFKHLTASWSVREFTVEDPNEKFDDLRDFCDLQYLRANVPEFAELRIVTDLPAEKLDAKLNIPVELIVPAGVRRDVMSRTKIMPRQFDRLVEMHTLSHIPQLHRTRNRTTKKMKASNVNDKAYYLWRLYAKQRLYIFNKDQLGQIEREERIEKLDSALDSVQHAYGELLERVEEREKAIANGDIEGSDDSAAKPGAAKRKRPTVGDDEDEEELEASPQGAGVTNEINGNKKKAKVV
ncbi:Putative acyl-CoA N-acyltransferase, histone acetyltransferase type B, catalytic subunit [Septoria linicola]|uniref:Histone acetyltransferase type B catalytic subunit n=1 Tax=Septoria linicola TaxID=215465 RepID=A0A9Q9AUU1_9PEZI|nr:putative acyl-CoA N-acyltransferase, histone acetyltransferase type B, catalytic subunit [Septoria linicola]USW52296.1 Putative acyl-CoA N-acyltransferase, histone acetyltransferase type B, catalytic subunit [Septoria linicola]